jgi:heme A synthase
LLIGVLRVRLSLVNERTKGPGMNYVTSRGFRRLAVATALALYLLIVIGGTVRVTESGLGCPDWPLCHGRLLPPLEITALVEFSHRLIALISGVLVLSTVFVALRKYRNQPLVVLPAAAVIAIMVIQVPVGGLVVATELEPLVVAFHLGTAMLILANALAVAVVAHQPVDYVSKPAARRFPVLPPLTGVALLCVLLSGALVVGGDASYACPDWPLCQGRLLPGVSANLQVAIQFFHRGMVGLVSILIVMVVARAIRKWRAIQGVTTWAALLGGFFLAQVLVGAVQIWLVLPPALRILHLATATATWASIVVLNLLLAVGQEKAAAPGELASVPIR